MITNYFFFAINDIYLCTFISRGDHGERRGLLNPSWYGPTSTQYGNYVEIVIGSFGVSLNNDVVNKHVNIDSLDLDNADEILFKFGNGETNVGGLNLFGKHFGDYPQDIKVRCLLEKSIN